MPRLNFQSTDSLALAPPSRRTLTSSCNSPLGGALIAGVILAKKKRYRAHGACQTTALLLNLWMIGFEMWPSFRLHIAPHLPRVFHTAYYAIATVHATLGRAAELLGIYIAHVAGTKLLHSSKPNASRADACLALSDRESARFVSSHFHHSRGSRRSPRPLDRSLRYLPRQ